MLRSPQLGSHSVLNCPVAQAVWWGEGMTDYFQRRSKDHNQCSLLFSTGQAVHWQLVCFLLQCLRWSKEDVLEAEELIRVLSQKSTLSIHNFTGMFSKLFPSWFLRRKVPILVSERPDSNGVFSLRSDWLQFRWYWEVQINAIERVEVRRNEKTFFRGKNGWSCFSFAGKADQYLLFSKSLSIFWKKIFCFKTQRISCEPSKLFLFSLPHVFHIKYWNKKLVSLGHLLQYSEFIVAESLTSFRRESHFSVETNCKNIFKQS